VPVLIGRCSFYNRIAATYQKDRWWVVLTSILRSLMLCAFQTRACIDKGVVAGC
jgi:hypothetical protein